ncbi:hypothetical protein ACHHYP_07154 [Achlya hypogyna]|uniref:Secreted protein n=1 Tax=Achlya hypogyna TaxID=1202772 RepID=A0A1V9ZMN4_ACHHY|nr:hypothetical protein ACHHYP_07154 [Achlya hypogyna]
MRRRLALVALVVAALRAHEDVRVDSRPPREFRPVTDPAIVHAAEFAVTELRRLSDTGIYTTLSLHEIKSGATQEGDFHYNTYLTLELASPHFKSGQPVEPYEIVVMESLDADRRKSFAIDNFPEMDDDAIEAFWIEMVEHRRQQRREIFAAWSAASEPVETEALPTRASLHVQLKDEL